MQLVNRNLISVHVSDMIMQRSSFVASSSSVTRHIIHVKLCRTMDTTGNAKELRGFSAFDLYFSKKIVANAMVNIECPDILQKAVRYNNECH